LRIFLDTEFTGLHQKTTLISLGIVTENNETFYAEFNDYDTSQIDDWLKFNIIEKLKFKNEVDYFNIDPLHSNLEIKADTPFISAYLVNWLDNIRKHEKIEVWSDCLSYDWVLFNNLFGGALNIPSFIYYIPFDICTLFKYLKIDSDISREKFANVNGPKHNALHDAIVIKQCYEKLMTI
jgi:hypothetical protein